VRRTQALVALSAAAIVVVGGGAVYASQRVSTRTVTLAVDGQSRPFTTSAHTVGGVLSAAHVRFGQHDTVAPDPSVTVRRGSLITVRHGRLLTLSVDGRVRTVWLQAATVQEALDQLGLRTDGMQLTASRSRAIPLDGMALGVSLPHHATVLADGRSIPVFAAMSSVSDAITAARVTLGSSDQVSVPIDAPVTEGLVIKVTRVSGGQSIVTLPIPFGVTRIPDGSLFAGQTRVQTAGVPGALQQVFEVTYMDGRPTDRALLSQQQTAAPRNQVLLVGTRPVPVAAPRPAPVSGPPAAGGGLNWAALARCESGGNPRAVSPGGTYLGLYQFSMSTWASVGGSGSPIDASPAEQTYRAQLLYARSGRAPWPVCGRYL
jgi:resuscitation-promoting factor RpfB